MSDEKLQRYDLLCRALAATPDGFQPALSNIDSLEQLIKSDFLALTRLASPKGTTDIYLKLLKELERLQEFSAEPRLAEKTIVAFGGPFSAGKSSLINTLIGQRVLVSEIDPTTALPAYVFAGDKDEVNALNSHRLRIALTDDELASLNHGERDEYGSEVSRSLLSAFVTRQNFLWDKLAFIDTPGFTGRTSAGDATDAVLSHVQLAGAHAIVWVVNIKQGNLTEDDLQFLAKFDTSIPKIVVASHSDQVSETDRASIIHRMKETLINRNVAVQGVYAVSSRPRHKELMAPLIDKLNEWNKAPEQQQFAYRFKQLFTDFKRGLEKQRDSLLWQQFRINRLLMLAEQEQAEDANELKAVNAEQLRECEELLEQLRQLTSHFFTQLKNVGDVIGVKMPEPAEVDLLQIPTINLLDKLSAIRKANNTEKIDATLLLKEWRKHKPVCNANLILNKSKKQYIGYLRSARFF